MKNYVTNNDSNGGTHSNLACVATAHLWIGIKTDFGNRSI